MTTRHDGDFESTRNGSAPVSPNPHLGPNTPAGGKVDRGAYEGRTPYHKNIDISSERQGR